VEEVETGRIHGLMATSPTLDEDGVTWTAFGDEDEENDQTVMKRRKSEAVGIIMAVAAVALVAAALGAGHGSSAPTKAQERSEYLAIVAPFDAANYALPEGTSASDITVASLKAPLLHS
jgi:hypothetical protein